MLDISLADFPELTPNLTLTFCSNFLSLTILQTIAYLWSKNTNFMTSEVKHSNTTQHIASWRALLVLTAPTTMCCHLLTHYRTSMKTFWSHLIHVHMDFSLQCWRHVKGTFWELDLMAEKWPMLMAGEKAPFKCVGPHGGHNWAHSALHKAWEEDKSSQGKS